ncbi:unnamed protein product [Agarophyton chilense]
MNDSDGDHRFDDATVSFSSDDMLSLAPTGQEIAVPLVPQFKTFKKLEVIDSKRIDFMTRAYNIAAFIAFLFSATVIIMARTAFSMSFKGIPDQFPDLTVYTFPKAFVLIDSLLFFMLFTYSLALLTVFAFVLVKQGKARLLNEQVWVFFLLVSTVVYLIPFEASIRLRRDFFELPVPEAGNDFTIIDVFLCLRYCSFSFIYILYLWLGAHGYRYLNRTLSFTHWKFYAPKSLLIFAYVGYKLGVLFTYRITFSEMPFASFVGFLNLYGAVKEWPTLGVVTIAVLTVFELVIALWISIDIIHTFRVLRKAPYVDYRTKILGYRFFLHQQIVFNVVYITTFVLILFGLPNGAQILQFSINLKKHAGRGSYFDVLYAPFGLNLCILAFATVEAYTNLPAEINLKGSLLGCQYKSLNREKVHCEPVVYRNTEPHSFSRAGLDLRPNCFVMQTTVQLFNLSWFVYYHGTEKENKLGLERNSLPVKIKDFMYDKTTDTKAIVAESSDRITVAFKGTSSTQNLRTDIKFLHRSLAHVLDIEDVSEFEQQHSMPPTWFKYARRAKVHAGFADAYQSIKGNLRQILSSLAREEERLVLFTGHSLGGALATLCSIDALITLGIPSRRIAVSTFGSPRVGNEAFQEIYDAEILMHWRIVAGGDIISRLPKLGYRHVGKKVILTSTGELFIDPSALEMIFWHSQTASIVHHRKACYLLAIDAWCKSLGTDYKPDFWPFPVSENDSRKFVTTFQKPNSQRRNYASLSRTYLGTRTVDRAKRMQVFADAIDGLRSNDQELKEANEDIVIKWAKLAQAVLYQNASAHFTV